MSSRVKPRRVPARFIVTKVVDNTSKGQLELDLMVAFSVNDKVDQYKCFARDFWYRSQLIFQPEDFINIFDAKVENPNDGSPFVATLVVDNSAGLIVIKPDTLISATTLMGTSFCMRKTWISRLFSGGGEGIKAFLIGNVVHELFQECLRANTLTVSEIDHYFRGKLLNSATLSLYELGISQAEFIAEIEPYIKSIAHWFQMYTQNDSKGALFSIHRLHEIENSIWSTKYGLIGKIDLSLEINLQDRANNSRSRNLIPLELKTGKHTFSPQHSGQVILYSYIMTEKYPQLKPTDGYLVYLKDETKTEQVKSNHNVFRDIIILRNKFVHYYDLLGTINFKNSSQVENILMKGPAPIENERACSKCEHQLDCSLIYKCFDSGHFPDQKFDIADSVTAHLNADDIAFFTKIISLLEVEKQYSVTADKSVHFWNIRSEDCELSSIGLSKMQIQFQTRDTITFMRSSKVAHMDNFPRKLFTMNSDVQINYSLLEDRRVIISEELVGSVKTYEIYGNFCKQLCVATGSVNNFTPDSCAVTIQLEKDQINLLNPNSLYRIDFLQNLSNRPMGTNFSNILRLMSPEEEQYRELRDIVIRGQFPQHNVNTCKVSSLSQIFNSPILNRLNVQQKKAIIGVLRTRCSLIYGSPGSGKTQTIVALVQILAQLGYSVLVTSYTHVAVDNILLKLAQAPFTNFLRTGQRTRIHPKLIEFSDYYKTKTWCETGDLASLTAFYNSVPIVASTCLGVDSHPLFAKRQFDFCILDEASQVFMATSLGPIFLANNFVLVGDQKQLPPVIQSVYARKQGLEESLFARLLKFADKENILSSGDSPDAFDKFDDFLYKQQNVNQIDAVRIFPLFIQYRMNRVIMNLANKLTYSGKLQCATKEIELASLNHYLKENSALSMDEVTSTYLGKAVSPSLDDSVIFLDTSGILKAVEISVAKSDSLNRPLGGRSVGGYVYNDFEAQTIVRLIQTLLSIYGKSGLTASDIGVISPFQRQVARIRELIGEEIVHEKHIEVNTVDQYQGRDKEVIIYSCVKSFFEEPENDDSQASGISLTSIIDSELLKDERRLNVAVTRAKKKLIIIGNRRTLERYSPFRKMFTVLQVSQFVQLSSLNCDDILNSLEATNESE